MNISQCSLQQAVSCNETATVTEVAQLMAKTGSRQVIVTSKEQPVGIISVTDIATRVVAQKKNPEKTKVKEVMTTPLICLDAETPVEKAYLHMIQKNTFSIPITKQGKLAGILPFSKSLGQNKC